MKTTLLCASALALALTVSPALAQFSGGGGTPGIGSPGFRSSFYYPSVLTGAGITGVAQTASEVYCFPYPVPAGGMTIKGMGANATTGDASHHVSFALYNSAGGLPSTKIDSVAAVSLPSSPGAVTGSLVGTTAALTSGAIIFMCETQESTTGVLWGSGSTVSVNGMLGVAAPLAAVSVPGVQCLAGSTCNGMSAWSAGAITWSSDLTGSTWATGGSTGNYPLLWLQAN